MQKRLVLAIDQGTTSTRAFIIDRDLNIVAASQKEFTQYYPKAGWVEHNPEDIWASTQQVVGESLQKSGLNPASIAGIGITNQRETTVIWNRKTGKPIHNAIVWQDRRTANICKELADSGKEPIFSQKSGLVIDPYFSGTKITWHLDNVPNARARAKSGDLAFGTIDTYLTWRLTGGKTHATDVSNASRTLCMNLETLSWDDELLDLLQIESAILPKIVPSSSIIGETLGLNFLPDGIPIAGMIGDQQSALFGQACFDAGESKCTYGTGSFLLMNTGEKIVRSNERLLTTVGWQINGKTNYALEASVFVTGAAVQWLRDGLGIIRQSSEVEELASRVDSSEGVIFVPALSGLGAPHWKAHARGVITGISRGTTTAHIARATLDGIAFQQCDLITCIEKDSGTKISNLKVDGGAAANNLLMQIQSDLLGIEIVRPKQIETTVMGAAFLAGLATGVWKSKSEIRRHWREDRRFKPRLDGKKRGELLAKWRDTVKKA